MRPITSLPSLDRAASSHRPKRHRRSVAAAVLTGLLVSTGAGGVAQAAPTVSSSKNAASSAWLSFTVTGSDSSTRLFSSGVPGGGQLVSFFQQPASGATSAEDRDLTFHVDGKIVAARAAALKNGTMAPSADTDLKVKTANDESTFTVDSQNSAQTIYLLPAAAPKAADPDDQNALEKLWGKITGLITGDDDDNSDDSPSEDSSSAPTSSSTATSTAQPTGSPTQDDQAPGGKDQGDEQGDSTGTSTSTSTSTTPSSSSSSSSSPSDDCLATSDPTYTAGPITEAQPDRATSERNPQDSASSDRDPSSGPTGPAAQPTTTPTATAKDSSLTKACSPAAGDPDTDGPTAATPSAPSSGNPGSSGARVSMQNQASGLPFMLGASGEGVASGAYAQALGRDVDIAATWANDNQNMVDLPQLQPGGEYGNWKKALDISIGAIDQNAGESWAQAASGAYDDRWTKSIENMKKLRAGADGDTYIRFAHEWNGSWFSWSVKAGDTENFKKAWQRFADLAHGIWPDAKLVMSQNRESNGYDGNWEDAFPGNQYVDALNVDYYNNWPYADTLEQFQADLDEKDGYGGPKGLNAHAEFAKSKNLTLSLGEWSGVQGSEGGDSPAFIEGSFDYFDKNAGTGPGQILYVCQFNVASAGNGKFNLLMGTQQPQASSKFKQLFGAGA